MRSQAYKVCEEILNYLVNSGFSYQVSRHSLIEAITWIRGGDPRTIQNWIRNLQVLGFIEMVNPNVFKLQLVRCPEALEKAVKVQGQKKLM
jgi:hypothetical protein